jgi:hypothetical protein
VITTAVANRLCIVIADAFKSDGLVALETVCPSPIIRATTAMREFEIQVSEGPAEFLDVDGNVLRIQQRIIVGMFIRMMKDDGGKYSRALVDAANSIYVKNLILLKVLHGNFLLSGSPPQPLLVRPLTWVGEGGAHEASNVPGLLVKECTYVCGFNMELPLR